jgi:hypothetical protein
VGLKRPAPGVTSGLDCFFSFGLHGCCPSAQGTYHLLEKPAGRSGQAGKLLLRLTYSKMELEGTEGDIVEKEEPWGRREKEQKGTCPSPSVQEPCCDVTGHIAKLALESCEVYRSGDGTPNFRAPSCFARVFEIVNLKVSEIYQQGKTARTKSVPPGRIHSLAPPSSLFT